MNVLFLNNGRFAPVNSHTMYSDLMREFQKHGHTVCVVSANERRNQSMPEYYEEAGIKIVCVRIGNLTKCSLIEKTITTITIADCYIKGIKKYFANIKFDLILYPTPPITLLKAVEFVKRRDSAKTYLLLKDIFPQNAVDIGMMSKTGLRGFIYKHFRRTEERLYKVSDYIGCMSQANVDYVLQKNPGIDPVKVEVCPNCIEVQDKSVDNSTRIMIRERYGLPSDKKIFIYGGNLGKPQDIPFIIECLKTCNDVESAYFLIVGSGSEYGKLQAFFSTQKPSNAKLMSFLPKEDYDSMVGACDVGMIFLDHRFTIPNFPSRLISYMQAKIPVLAATDTNSDIGKVIEDGGFGWWCESNDSQAFRDIVDKIVKIDLTESSDVEFNYLVDHFSVEKVYHIVFNRLSTVQ